MSCCASSIKGTNGKVRDILDLYDEMTAEELVYNINTYEVKYLTKPLQQCSERHFIAMVKDVKHKNPIFKAGETLNTAMEFVARTKGKATIEVHGVCGEVFTIKISKGEPIFSKDGKKMKSFKSIDKYNIKGHGTVFSVINDETFRRGECRLIGERVLINEKMYQVKGVESFTLEIIQKGMPIGLLVEDMGPVKNEKEIAE
jgi:hypothetical protein